MNVRSGSRADSTVTVSIRPLLGLKRTQSAEKRTLRSKVCFPPESGSRQAGARTSAPSADQLGDPLEGTTPKGELEWWQREAAHADTEEQRRIVKHNREFLSRMPKAAVTTLRVDR